MFSCAERMYLVFTLSNTIAIQEMSAFDRKRKAEESGKEFSEYADSWLDAADIGKRMYCPVRGESFYQPSAVEYEIAVTNSYRNVLLRRLQDELKEKHHREEKELLTDFNKNFKKDMLGNMLKEITPLSMSVHSESPATSPAYSPTSPAYRPTSPAYSPSPAYYPTGAYSGDDHPFW